jgi:hypothetical protein
MMVVPVPNTSWDSRGKLAALAGVAPPLRQTFASVTNQPLPLAMRHLLGAIAPKARPRPLTGTVEKTGRMRRKARPPSIQAVAILAGIAVLVTVALMRQGSMPWRK